MQSLFWALYESEGLEKSAKIDKWVVSETYSNPQIYALLGPAGNTDGLNFSLGTGSGMTRKHMSLDWITHSIGTQFTDGLYVNSSGRPTMGLYLTNDV